MGLRRSGPAIINHAVVWRASSPCAGGVGGFRVDQCRLLGVITCQYEDEFKFRLVLWFPRLVGAEGLLAQVAGTVRREMTSGC